MTRRQPGAVTVVQRDAALFEPFQQAVQQHHTRHLLHQHLQLGVGDLLGMHHQRRAAVAHQLLNRLPLLLLVMVTVTNQQKVAGLACHLVDRFHHGAEKGIGNVAHH